jgi:hypothetical protein
VVVLVLLGGFAPAVKKKKIKREKGYQQTVIY